MKLDTIIYETKNKKIYRDGDLAIKVFDENFSKAAVLNEALNQARVEEIEGINTPKLHEVTVWTSTSICLLICKLKFYQSALPCSLASETKCRERSANPTSTLQRDMSCTHACTV